MTDHTESFAARVWQKLAVIDVSSVTERKGKLDYVSWSACWTDIKRVFPESTFHREADTEYPDGTVDVNMWLVIREGDQELPTAMWLPVMDNHNNAIQHPTARHRSDARMRCIVKAASVHGYGLSMWRKTELIDAGDFSTITQGQVDELRELLAQSTITAERFLKAAGVEALEQIPERKYAVLKRKLEGARKKAA